MRALSHALQRSSAAAGAHRADGETNPEPKYAAPDTDDRSKESYFRKQLSMCVADGKDRKTTFGAATSARKIEWLFSAFGARTARPPG